MFTNLIARQQLIVYGENQLITEKLNTAFCLDVSLTICNIFKNQQDIQSLNYLSQTCKVWSIYIKDHCLLEITAIQKWFNTAATVSIFIQDTIPQFKSLDDGYKIFIETCCLKNCHLSLFILKNKAINPSIQSNYALNHAIERGRTEFVHALINDERVDVKGINKDVVLKAGNAWYASLVKLLITHPRIHIPIDNCNFLIWATQRGFEEVVEIILNRLTEVKTQVESAEIIKAASWFNLKLIKQLLMHPKIDSSLMDSEVLIWAGELGYIDIVEIIINKSKGYQTFFEENDFKNIAKTQQWLITYNNNNAVQITQLLIWASRNGYIDIVMSVVEKRYVNYSFAIVEASKQKHVAIVKILFPMIVDIRKTHIPLCEQVNYRNRLDIISQVVENLIEVPEANFLFNQQLLNLAITVNHTNLITLLLLDSRINPSANDYESILLASKLKLIEIIKILYNAKQFDPNINDQFLLNKACSNGYTELVKCLLDDVRVDPSLNNSKALHLAMINNNTLDVIECLIADPRVDITINNNQLIEWASKNGHFKLIDHLLADRRIDPTTQAQHAIITAGKNNRTKIVKNLLSHPHVNLSAEDNLLIQWASKRGYVDIVTKLLEDPNVDPSANDNYAVKQARAFGHVKIIDLLDRSKRFKF